VQEILQTYVKHRDPNKIPDMMKDEQDNEDLIIDDEEP
jgi:hypothetical protein